MTANDILHDLLQRGDSAQKYMQGSKNVKVDNWILLDNVVRKSSIAAGARSRALQRQSKRSKRHMSIKQHKKFGSFDLPQESHKLRGRAQPQGSIERSLTLHFCQRLFSRLEPVTS